MTKFSKWVELENEPQFEKILRQKPHKSFDERKPKKRKKYRIVRTDKR